MPLMARYDPFSSSPAAGKSLPAIDRLFHNSTPDYGASRNQVRPVGAASPNSSSIEDRIRAAQDTQQTLLEDILVAYKERAAEQRMDIDRYIRANRQLQIDLDTATSINRDTQRALSENTYLSILIDGSALTFSKSALQSSPVEFANSWVSTLENWMTDLRSLAGNLIDTHTTMFLDIQSAAHRLVDAGWVDSTTDFIEFVKNLNDTEHSSFDIIDTRNASSKMLAHYRQEYRNLHCHKVLLGAALNKDNPLATVLQSEAPTLLQRRVAIIQNEKVASDFGCDHVDLSSAFVPIPEPASMPLTRVLSKSVYAPSPPPMIKEESQGSVLTTPTVSQPSTPALSWAATAAHPFGSQPQKLALPIVTASVIPLRTKVATPKITEVQRNKLGQRIDTIDENIPYQELQRIKKMKLCNVFFLQGPSFCKGNCGHSHEYPLKSHEKSILREVARMTPCYYKLECKEPDCIYGHRCPQSKPDRKDCYYKDDCRFKGWGHGIDLNIVKTTSIKG